jgi:hypothetical protein
MNMLEDGPLIVVSSGQMLCKNSGIVQITWIWKEAFEIFKTVFFIKTSGLFEYKFEFAK